jgi:hypothetical protein
MIRDVLECGLCKPNTVETLLVVSQEQIAKHSELFPVDKFPISEGDQLVVIRTVVSERLQILRTVLTV